MGFAISIFGILRSVYVTRDNPPSNLCTGPLTPELSLCLVKPLGLQDACHFGGRPDGQMLLWEGRSFVCLPAVPFSRNFWGHWLRGESCKLAGAKAPSYPQGGFDGFSGRGVAPLGCGTLELITAGTWQVFAMGQQA